MINGAQLIEATEKNIASSDELGFEAFLLEHGVEADAVRALVRYHGPELVERSEDVRSALVRAVILGFIAGVASRELQVPA